MSSRTFRAMLIRIEGQNRLRELSSRTSLPTRGPTGSATAAGRPPPALAVAPQPALCEGWPATGTLVRKTSRAGPCRLRADDVSIIGNARGVVKSLGKIPFFCS
jgi:hypothetical protein